VCVGILCIGASWPWTELEDMNRRVFDIIRFLVVRYFFAIVVAAFFVLTKNFLERVKKKKTKKG
jgi:hypothetical protein